MLRLFDNYMIELQTNARQYLTPDRVMEYIEQLKNKKEYEKCAAFFIYVIATRYNKNIILFYNDKVFISQSYMDTTSYIYICHYVTT